MDKANRVWESLRPFGGELGCRVDIEKPATQDLTSGPKKWWLRAPSEKMGRGDSYTGEKIKSPGPGFCV